MEISFVLIPAVMGIVGLWLSSVGGIVARNWGDEFFKPVPLMIVGFFEVAARAVWM
jgi:hypothetical protein